MRISVTVKPNAKKDEVLQIDETHIAVSVTMAPRKGKANEAVMRVLAEHFHIAKSRMRIVSGHTAKQKIIEISQL